MNKEIWVKNMLKQVLYTLEDRHSTMMEFDFNICSDEFADMKEDIECIINEVIDNLN